MVTIHAQLLMMLQHHYPNREVEFDAKMHCDAINQENWRRLGVKVSKAKIRDFKRLVEGTRDETLGIYNFMNECIDNKNIASDDEECDELNDDDDDQHSVVNTNGSNGQWWWWMIRYCYTTTKRS